MACSKWEEIGLLYCSRELDEQEAKLYDVHLANCSECNLEFTQYQNDKKSFFTPEILGEITSKEVDEEIIRVCTAKKQYTSIGIFPALIKKSIYSVSFFLLGFTVVGYFVYNVENANNQKKNLALDNPSSITTPVLAEQESTSSFKDSIKDSAVYFSRTRGNLETRGVFPVDLK
jgi:hypothetical protein